MAAVVYLVLAVTLRSTGRWRKVAIGAALVELGGALTVGTAELVGATAWPDETVWSGYGIGYGFAPVVLPLAAITALLRQLRSHAPSEPPVPAL